MLQSRSTSASTLVLCALACGGGGSTASAAEPDSSKEQDARLPSVNDVAPASRRIFTHGDAGFICIRIPATALLVDGSLLSVAGGRCFTGDSCFPIGSGRASGTRNFSAMVARRSTDAGNHWDEIAVLAVAKHGLNNTRPVCTKSDPALVVDLLHNRVHLMYTDPIGTAWRIESRDHGQTWSHPPVLVPMGPECRSPPAPVCNSHIAPGTGIQLSSARSAHPGRLLIVAIVEEKSFLNRVLRSDDGGTTWLPSATSIVNCGEAQVAELDDGSIYMNCRLPKTIDHGQSRGRSISTDGGVTWTPVEVDRQTPGANCMGSLITHPTNKSIVFFVHPSNLTERSNGAVYRSEDAGRSWSTAFSVAGEGIGSQFAYSSLTYLPAGAGARRPDQLGLAYETWAEGCEPQSPACAIDFVTLPTAWG